MMGEPDYKDDTGKSVSLSTLCRTNPEWATSHIRNVHDEIERLTQQHESDKALVQATEACARHHQERAESLTAEVSRLEGDLALLRPVCSAKSGGLSRSSYVCPCCDGSGGITSSQFNEWDKMKSTQSGRHD